MIDHILLICFSVFVYKFIIYVDLKNIIIDSIIIYKKIFKLFKYSYASDFRKEKLIFNYSKKLFKSSLKIITIIIFIFIFLKVLNYFSNSFLNLFFSILGIFELSLFLIIYRLVKKKINV